MDTTSKEMLKRFLINSYIELFEEAQEFAEEFKYEDYLELIDNMENFKSKLELFLNKS